MRAGGPSVAARVPACRSARSGGPVAPLLLAPFLLLSPVAAQAQQGTLSLDLGASYSVPPAGSSAEAAPYANLGTRLEASFGESAFLFGAAYGGLALDNDGASWVSGLAGGGLLSQLSGSLAIGISGAGEAFTVGAPHSYSAVTLQAEPELRFTSGLTTVRLRGYGGVGSSEVDVVDSFFRLTRVGLVRIDAGATIVSELWAWGGGLELMRWLGDVQPRIALEVYDAPQGGYVAGRLGLFAALDIAAWYMELAVWDTPGGTEAAVTASLELPLGGAISGLFGGGRFGPDPLLDAPAAGGASASASLRAIRFGRRPALVCTVRYAEGAYVRFELHRPDAETASLLGDFSGWDAVPMVSDSGLWTVELQVEPGSYHFGFQVDGSWYVPEEAPGLTTDEWGLPQATLVVREE